MLKPPWAPPLVKARLIDKFEEREEHHDLHKEAVVHRGCEEEHRLENDEQYKSLGCTERRQSHWKYSFLHKFSDKGDEGVTSD